jgi:hypothetical protein
MAVPDLSFSPRREVIPHSHFDSREQVVRRVAETLLIPDQYINLIEFEDANAYIASLTCAQVYLYRAGSHAIMSRSVSLLSSLAQGLM